MYVEVSWVREKILGMLSNFPLEHAEIVADALIWAEAINKKDMGVIKLAGTEPIQNSLITGEIEITKNKTTTSIKGNGNLSVYVTNLAATAAAEAAKEYGIGIATANGMVTSNTTQSFYTNKIADEGLIGFIFSRSAAAQTGYGSIEPHFGTNPLGFSFPTLTTPFCIDFSTSAITWYKLILHQLQNKKLPNNVAFNSDGEITINPNDAIEGALLPRSGDLNFTSLAFAVELLGGVLAGANYGEIEDPFNFGATIIAINPEFFVGEQKFREATSEALDQIQNSKTQYDTSIQIPGSNYYELYSEMEKTGFLTIDELILDELKWLD